MRGGEDALRALVAPICAAHGLDLFDLEVRAHAIQVTVEGAGALDLDRVAEVAKAISATLDAHEELTPAGRYELEVTSPGVERRLRRLEHYVGALGETVALRLVPGAGQARRVEGTVVAADDGGVVVETPSGTAHLALSQIERAHVVFDWRAALRTGKAAPTAAAARGES